MATISKSGKRKQYHSQFSIALTPIERMAIEYYAARYGKDKGDIFRGILRKYLQSDPRFDVNAFQEWAEKSYVPYEEDKSKRSLMREQLASCEELLGLIKKSKAKSIKKSS